MEDVPGSFHISDSQVPTSQDGMYSFIIVNFRGHVADCSNFSSDCLYFMGSPWLTQNPKSRFFFWIMEEIFSGFNSRYTTLSLGRPSKPPHNLQHRQELSAHQLWGCPHCGCGTPSPPFHSGQHWAQGIWFISAAQTSTNLLCSFSGILFSLSAMTSPFLLFLLLFFFLAFNRHFFL